MTGQEGRSNSRWVLETSSVDVGVLRSAPVTALKDIEVDPHSAKYRSFRVVGFPGFHYFIIRFANVTVLITTQFEEFVLHHATQCDKGRVRGLRTRISYIEIWHTIVVRQAQVSAQTCQYGNTTSIEPTLPT